MRIFELSTGHFILFSLSLFFRNRAAGLEAAGGEEPASPALDLKSSGVATPKTGSKLESALDKLGLQKRKVRVKRVCKLRYKEKIFLIEYLIY